ncbi:MAG: hypothetical protein RR998_00270 [Oscillospiraceae bacterium]
MEDKKINVGIGFATGRKSFQRVLKNYMYSFMESGLTDLDTVGINVFVAYDLKYSNTQRSDYTNISKHVADLIDEVYFIGNKIIQNDIHTLVSRDVIDEQSADILFGSGYAGKRNAVLFNAMKHGTDYLLFLDDDEYPLAVTHTRAYAVWSGQQVLKTHLRNIQYADITNGYHCGYVSPIPLIEYNDKLKEEDFRTFIEAISNDILNWNTIKYVMERGGVSYSDTNVLISEDPLLVHEKSGAKFISGANLCINLTDPERLFPFYNPPGARGEDTFLSTLLGDRTVLRVPCYTFHDGFSTYQHIMDGVLPTQLSAVTAQEEIVVSRFYKACIGWIRYKPLFLYITDRENYEDRIAEMREKLAQTLPKVCAYFDKPEFMKVLSELEKYNKNVRSHLDEFQKAQQAWSNICRYLKTEGGDLSETPHE